MNIDWSDLAVPFAEGTVTVDGVYRRTVPEGLYNGHNRDNPTTRAGLLFVLRGTGTAVCNGTPYRLAPGIVLHGARNMVLSLAIDPPELEYGLVHYKLEGAGKDEAAWTDAHFTLEVGERPAIVGLLEQMQDEHAIPGPLSALRVKGLFYELLHETLAAARNRLNRESETLVRHAADYIHSHYRERITLEQLARLEGVEVRRFAYLFRKYTGLFPIDYLIRYRMRKAASLLASSGCAIREIAESVGYDDAHYFSRLFRKYAGCSPKAYRADLGNRPPFVD